MQIDGAQDWTHAFPLLRQLPNELFVQLRDASLIVELPEGSRIFGPGQAPDSFLLLLDGTIRVQQTSESGREIVLYRVQAGESCALTTACLLGYEDYQAEGIAETRIRAVAMPRALFDRLIASSREFRQFVFTAFSRRVTNLFRLIEEVAFQRIDVRLAQKLLELARISRTSSAVRARSSAGNSVNSHGGAGCEWLAARSKSSTDRPSRSLPDMAREPPAR